ncbi:MAG: error-prone polymerase [Chloroflexota bacterium]|nr:error-prone polymerase [Chloroflexota bacterium]
MGVPGKPLHEKPSVATDELTQPAPNTTRVKPGPEAGYPGASPELVDAGFAAAPAGGLRQNRQWSQFFDICKRIQGFPRHLSIHVGGMLVTGEPLIDMLPVERATMPGRVVVQFNKDDVEDLGLIKMDMLGLRTLSVVEECLQLTEKATGTRPDLDALDLKDPEVYRIASEADTVGVFQIESRAQMATLPRTRPDRFSDLVVEVAIIRPGPIQGNAVNPYIRRRQGREEVTYPHPKLEPILKDTLGVILFQEQILEIAMSLGGYTPAQADGFRRAMDRHRHEHEMEALRDGFLRAVAEHSGVDAELGNDIFRSISGFAQFGFCRCLAGDTRITDPITGNSTSLTELADHFDYRDWSGGATLLAPPVTSVLSHVEGRLAPGSIGAVYRNGVQRVHRVLSHSGRAITATGNHPFLTPQGYRQLDDLAPGCEVALQWGAADIFWDRIAAIDDAGEQETFDITVEPHHNFVADGFVVHNSHAAAFARTTYETIWLRDRFPAAYYCALLNNQPMGFYHPAVLLEDAKRHGVEVLPVHVNLSRERCLPGDGGVGNGARLASTMRLGFNYVRGIGEGALERLRQERERGEFRDLQDFCDRVCTPDDEAVAAHRAAAGRRAGNLGTSLNPAEPAPLTREAVENLVMVGAFDHLGVARRRLLWDVRDAYEAAGRARLVKPAAEALPLPPMTELEVTATDYQLLEVTTGRHLMSYYREALERAGVVDSRALKDAPNESRVRVAGLVITRQAPGTAKRFRFFTLEDEWGHINLILHPDFFNRHRAVANRNQLLMFEGTVQNVDNVISVRATDVRALPPLEVSPPSHDYH